MLDNIYLSLFVEEDGGDDVADGLLEYGLEVGGYGRRHSLRRHRLVLVRQAAQPHPVTTSRNQCSGSVTF
jgi:hypothetical protein